MGFPPVDADIDSSHLEPRAKHSGHAASHEECCENMADGFFVHLKLRTQITGPL